MRNPKTIVTGKNGFQMTWQDAQACMQGKLYHELEAARAGYSEQAFFDSYAHAFLTRYGCAWPPAALYGSLTGLDYKGITAEVLYDACAEDTSNGHLVASGKYLAFAVAVAQCNEIEHRLKDVYGDLLEAEANTEVYNWQEYEWGDGYRDAPNYERAKELAEELEELVPELEQWQQRAWDLQEWLRWQDDCNLIPTLAKAVHPFAALLQRLKIELVPVNGEYDWQTLYIYG